MTSNILSVGVTVRCEKSLDFSGGTPTRKLVRSNRHSQRGSPARLSGHNRIRDKHPSPRRSSLHQLKALLQLRRKKATKSAGGGVAFSVVKAEMAKLSISVYQPSLCRARSALGDLSSVRVSSGRACMTFSLVRRSSVKSPSCAVSAKL
jgi:hypothetical protein